MHFTLYPNEYLYYETYNVKRTGIKPEIVHINTCPHPPAIDAECEYLTLHLHLATDDVHSIRCLPFSYIPRSTLIVPRSEVQASWHHCCPLAVFYIVSARVACRNTLRCTTVLRPSRGSSSIVPGAYASPEDAAARKGQAKDISTAEPGFAIEAAV